MIDYPSAEEKAYMDIVKGNYLKALTYFVGRKPTIKVLLTIALIYATMEEWKRADENFERALKIKQDGLTYYNWGISYMKRTLHSEAIAMFKKALKQKKWWWLWEPDWYSESREILLGLQRHLPVNPVSELELK